MPRNKTGKSGFNLFYKNIQYEYCDALLIVRQFKHKLKLILVVHPMVGK